MKIRATFIGKNSLGYETNKEYDLFLGENMKITITRTDLSGGCIYNSFYAFLKNWSNVTLIK